MSAECSRGVGSGASGRTYPIAVGSDSQRCMALSMSMRTNLTERVGRIAIVLRPFVGTGLAPELSCVELEVSDGCRIIDGHCRDQRRGP